MKRFLIIAAITFIVLLSLFFHGRNDIGHVKLLAVSEQGSEIKGSLADLYLEIKPGTGKVFIDTQPASKLDTQMSTRLARNIACKFIDADCSGYDFFYTIKADSVIIGGPSASAAIAVMTVALLSNADVKEDISLTGTITSGNLIGSVAGVKEKIDAAASGKIKTVLIPVETRFAEKDATEKLRGVLLGNQSEDKKEDKTENNKEDKAKTEKDLGLIDLVEYGKEKGINVIPVETLNDVMKIMAGKDFEKSKKEIKKNPAYNSYTETMKMLGLLLCERSISLQEDFNSALLKNNNPLGAELTLTDIGVAINSLDRNKYPNGYEEEYEKADSIEEAKEINKKINKILKEKIVSYGKELVTKQQRAFNLTQKGQQAFNRKDYYSAASFCFGASVDYRNLLYSVSGLDSSEIKKIYSEVDSDIIKLNNKVNAYEIKTITDLQAYMIVKERLIEANDMLIEIGGSIKELEKNNSQKQDNQAAMIEAISSQLSFVIERTYSALAWAAFLGKSGKNFELGNGGLSDSCSSKLSEATEYYQYMNLMLPDFQQDTKKQLEKAIGFQKKENYAMCLFKATLAKAQVNMLASTISANEKELDAIVKRKIAAAEKVIAGQQENNVFPVLGYSYLEYAESLIQENKYSALLYAEYALELSNLDLYFNSEKQFGFMTGFSVISNSRLVRENILLIFIAGIMIGLLCAEIYSKAVPLYKHYRIKKLFKK